MFMIGEKLPSAKDKDLALNDVVPEVSSQIVLLANYLC